MEQTIFSQIDHWLSTNRPDYFALLNPPANEYLFDALRATVGIVLPQDFRKIYEWHDGQAAGSFDSLFQNLTFMTLMEMATTHQTHRDVSMIDQWGEDQWQPSWVPFLSNGGGDYFCIATESFREIPAGSILWYDHESSDREIIHSHPAAFLEDLYERMVTDRLECG